MYFCNFNFEKMNSKKKYFRYIVLLLCVALTGLFVSCQTSKNQTHKSSKYQKTRTRHTPKWNSTTSQNTTYYIKKHSTRKGHDIKRVKR